MAFNGLSEEQIIKIALDNNQHTRLTRNSRNGLERKLNNYCINNNLVLNGQNQLVPKMIPPILPFQPVAEPIHIVRTIVPNQIEAKFKSNLDSKQLNTHNLPIEHSEIEPLITVKGAFWLGFCKKLEYKSKYYFLFVSQNATFYL
jgi:hypothetical protein